MTASSVGSDDHESDQDGGSSPESLILAAIMDELERGRAPDADQLRSRFPGHELVIERLLRGSARYERLARAVRHEGAAAQLPTGGRLGDFEIVSALAHGGMGHVYRARQLSLNGRLVALKVLSDERPPASALDRFRREAAVLADIHHPSLAEVYGVGEQAGRFYYAMRLVEGPTLHDVLGRLARRRAAGRALTSIERRRIVAWARDVAAALAVVHAGRLVHRDVKPANIIIGGADAAGDELPEGLAVLVDFGLVRSVSSDALTLKTLAAATPPYASVEQLLGHAVDARADVFALGVTLHDLLSGRLPSERGAAAAGLPPLHSLDSAIDADLEAVVARAADPQAEWRYPSGAELRDDLEAWLHGQPVSARRSAPVERARRWVKENPARFVRRAIATLVVLVIAGLGIAWLASARSVALAGHAGLIDGDALAVSRAAEALSPRMAGLLAGDARLAETLRRLDSVAPDDPLVRLVDLDRQGNVVGAVQAASYVLAQDGYDSHSLAGAFLLRRLREALDRPSSGRGNAAPPSPDAAGDPKSSETRDVDLAAATEAARLSLEIESTPASRAAIVPFREVCLALWRGRDVSASVRMQALSALSGWGRPEDVTELIARMAELPDSAAEASLSLSSAERIVRRALRETCEEDRDALAQLDLRKVWDAAKDRCACITAIPKDPAGEYTFCRVAERFVTAVVRAGRWQAAGLPIDDLLTAAGRRGDASLNSTIDLRLLAAAGDPERLGRALDNTPIADLRASADSVGDLLGECGDTALTERQLSRLGSPGSYSAETADVVKLMKRHLAVGVQARKGISLDLDPDPDTRLDAQSQAVLTTTLDLAPGLARPDSTEGLGSLGLAQAHAAWEFVTNPARRYGAAVAAVLVGSDILDDAPLDPERGGCIRGGRFGTSEVRLTFTVSAGCLDRPPSSGEAWIQWDPELVLVNQLGTRDYLPDGGCAHLRVLLDGWSPLEDLTIASNMPHCVLVSIPLKRLQASGVHEIRLLLLPDSTATWRLKGVALQPGHQTAAPVPPGGNAERGPNEPR